MKSGKGSFEVRCAVQGKLRVLVVDATANVRSFEHTTTSQLVNSLNASGVPVTNNSPVLANSVEDFSRAFQTGEEWNTLLLISHGRAVSGSADILRLADLRTNWFLANGIDMKLEDKAVFLVVCEGACEDAIYVILREQLALLLVAPNGKLNSQEALDFFPPVLKELVGKSEFTPEDVSAAIGKHADKANGKMKILSAVGLPSNLDKKRVRAAPLGCLS